MNYSDLYKNSFAVDLLTDETYEFLDKAINKNYIPKSLRYEKISKGFRGVLETVDGKLVYFSKSDHQYRFILAKDDEKSNDLRDLHKSYTKGCELMYKAEDKVPEDLEDKEDEEKAVGGISSGGAAPRTESQYLQSQDHASTDFHSGAVSAQTPDLPEVGRNWHAEKSINYHNLSTILKSFGSTLKDTAPALAPHIPVKELEFMMEVLGRSPDDIKSGNDKLPPGLRAKFNVWLNKSLREKLNSLNNLLEKSIK